MLSLLSLLLILPAFGQPIYTIHYVRSYHPSELSQNMGCGENVAYGIYLYPSGVTDAQHIFLSSSTFQLPYCSHSKVFFKVFGPEQDYSKLDSPNQVATHIHSSLRGQAKKLIVDWKGENSQFLGQLVEELQRKQYEVYVKAPATYFCGKDDKSLSLIKNINNFIVEMYGEEKGQYLTYQSIFGTNGGCGRFPSLKDLELAVPGKAFFIEKTMQREEYGYIGPKFESFAKQAFKNNQMYFYDSHPRQIIYL